jgi:hypothetical protein
MIEIPPRMIVVMANKGRYIAGLARNEQGTRLIFELIFRALRIH